jgi:hypothetical protein
MRVLRNLLLLAALIQLNSGVPAAEMEPAETSIEYQDAKLTVTASVILPVQRCAAFKLLTDYDSIPSYVPGVLATRHEYLDESVARVWQTGQVKLLIFHFDVKSLLEVHEIPNEKITFRQLEGSLGSYAGSWNLYDESGATRVSYRAELSFRHFMPVLLAKLVLNDEIRSRFSAIAREAASRNDNGQLRCE